MKLRLVIMIVVLVASFSSIGSTATLAASMRYVAPGGVDAGNTCSASAAPCATIAYALTQAQDYDTINMAAGTYFENLTIIGRQLTITGPTSGAPAVIDGGNANSVFFVQASTLILSYLTIQHGGNVVYGAGIHASSTVLTVDHCLISDNHAVVGGSAGYNTYGGGIYTASNDTTVIRLSTISLNSAIGSDGTNGKVVGSARGGDGGIGSGGGVYVAGGPFTLSDTTITGNLAQGGAGGPADGISGNGGSGLGGGIYVDDTDPSIYIRASLFVDNRTLGGSGANVLAGYGFRPGQAASANGGGLYGTTSSSFSVTNSTFYHNYATGGAGGDGDSGAAGGSGYGGAVFLNNSAVYSVTIANNSAVGGAGGKGYGGTNGTGGTGLAGGLASDANTPDYVHNSIIANNLQGGNCYPELGNSSNVNLEWPGPTRTCGPSTSLQDPGFTGLVDKGGPTLTMPLSTGSPAIDAGYDLYCAVGTPVNGVDQRGVTRPQGPHCDIGAYEFVPAPTVALVTGFRATRQGGAILVRWQMARSREALGFDLYAGTHRLTQRTIARHRSPAYRALVQWPGPWRALRLHVLLRHGRVVRLRLP